MLRRLFLVAAGVIGLLVLVDGTHADAQVTPTAPPLGVTTTPPPGATIGCSARLAGQDIANHRSPGKAIHVHYNDDITVEGTASSTVSTVKYWIRIAGMNFSLGENFSTSDTTWSGEVNVKQYAWAGAGLYEVIGEAQTASGVCRDRVFVCIEGRSPFTTAAGGLATVSGLAGVYTLWRQLARRRTGTPSRAALATGGALTALGAVVLMQQMCIRPLTPLMLSIIPLGAVLAGTVAMIHGRGMPVPWTQPEAPPVTRQPTPPAKQQPRTEAKNIYQFRAPAKACTACKQHAMNKVYASSAAMKRAHPGCRCTVDWRPVDEASYTAYFRTGPEYDPRRAGP
jgi:hypothetical protein